MVQRQTSWIQLSLKYNVSSALKTEKSVFGLSVLNNRFLLFIYLFFISSVAPRNSCVSRAPYNSHFAFSPPPQQRFCTREMLMKIQLVQFRSPFCIFTDFRVHGTPLTPALFLDRIPFPLASLTHTDLATYYRVVYTYVHTQSTRHCCRN